MYTQKHVHLSVHLVLGKVNDSPIPLSQAGDNEAGTLSQEAPVRSGRWALRQVLARER